MSMIVSTTLVIAAIGCIVGLGLVFMSKKFEVKHEELENAVRSVLPGVNCGACGYAGCDAMATALVGGTAPINGCAIGGAPLTKKLSELLGITSVEPLEPKIAFVQCKGTCEVTKNQGNYVGPKDCRSVVLSGLHVSDCAHGCLGLGTCASVCPQKAIVMQDGVAAVYRGRCVGCGLCVKACPKGLITLVPESSVVAVRCSNRDKGVQVKQVCSAGCIGCGICEKVCEAGAITVSNNLARVNQKLCNKCGKCAEKCPVKVITTPHAH